MEVYLQAHGVWESIVCVDTSTNEAKRYNSKAMNVILNVFPNYVKTNVGQCSIAKDHFEKLHNLYSKKQPGQDVIENGEMSKTKFQNQVIKVINV